MKIALRQPFWGISFSRQFLLVGSGVVVASMAVFGVWLGRQIETGVVNRATEISANYVESIVAAELRDWPASGEIVPGSEVHRALDRIFVDGTLRDKVLGFKLWAPDGRIVYSADHGQIGHRYPLEGLLAEAFNGKVQSRIENPEQWAEPDAPLRSGERQLEIYVPVRRDPGGRVVAVAEFDHSMESLDADITSAQRRGWALTAVCALAIYALMYGRVRQASNTILNQQRTLRQHVQQLRAAVEDNRHMRERLSEAGAQTTALNEQFLNRIAADLHDGPAQELAYALLRFDDLVIACDGCLSGGGGGRRELGSINDALGKSLEELRAIAAGLGVPGVDDLTLAETAQRALRDAERQSGCAAAADIDSTLGAASLALKITIYRVIRESVGNACRYAGPAATQVRVQRCGEDVLVEIRDEGAGFDPAAALASGRLGLLFMRERVRLAGGVFEINSAPGRGTTIRARIPLTAD